jgi:hypothetical protein
MFSTRTAHKVISTLVVLLYLSTLLRVSLPTPVKAVSSIDDALDKGISYFENVQSSHGHTGEFATYRWSQSNQGDKEYVHTVFTTPFVLHTLNYLATNYGYLPEVIRQAFGNMRSGAKTHLLDHMETKDGHTGIWRFFPPDGPYPWVPPDTDDTCCNLECLLSFDPSLWGSTISNDLTDYLLGYKRPSGAFQTWIIPMNTDVCSGTTANVVFFYGSRNEAYRTSDTMIYLNSMIDSMLLGGPYDAEYYRSEYAFTYMVSRAYSDGGVGALLNSSQRAAVRNYILSHQEADGSWPRYSKDGYLGQEDELETAMALASLINLGFNELSSTGKSKVESGINYLLNTQSLNGSWPCAVFYQGRPLGYFGSEEATTAICMEALAKYSVAKRSGGSGGCSVGGIVVPIDKSGLLALLIGLGSTTIVAAAASAVCVRRIRRRKEKQ